MALPLPISTDVVDGMRHVTIPWLEYFVAISGSVPIELRQSPVVQPRGHVSERWLDFFNTVDSSLPAPSDPMLTGRRISFPWMQYLTEIAP